ncbi:putative PurR-regulated permease PerM [Nocardiopsis mwathae]|uniref:Putative PurR-regulated permease PerM n=1 Tax=Nocardiopsis mwathae TaxID=1472723 RepID=A0A7W9YH03_9ACTN|nr:AI-2E family transporter [Nocardiopsis mwathae]MBB6171361.1 putative PurR-regulated permease PerM [Nocardiopsis mwathae]
MKRRKTAREVVAERPEPEPEEQEPQAEAPESEDLLFRMSSAAWRILVIGLFIAVIVYVLVQVRLAVIPVVLAVFLTALLMPPTNWMRRHGLGRGSSTTITIIGAFVVLGGVITLVVQPAIDGFAGLVSSVQKAVAGLPDLAERLGQDPAVVDQLIENVTDQVRGALQEDWSEWVSQAWAAGASVIELLVGLILVLVLTIYFVHSGDRLVSWLLTLFPAQTRRSLGAAGQTAYGVMGRYVRGVAMVGLIDAVGIGVFLIFLIDPSLAIPLIVLTFIGAFLPVIGAFVTGLLAALVALVTEDWVIALIVVAVVIIVQQLESHVFAPRVYGKALDLPAAVVLLAITIGGLVAGIAGMFLATPTVAVIAALLRNRPAVQPAAPQVREAEEEEANPAPASAAAAPATTERTEQQESSEQ